jgi:hypothetical protein
MANQNSNIQQAKASFVYESEFKLESLILAQNERWRRA